MTGMDASGLANIFEALGNHWAAPWVALGLGLRAIWSIIAWRRCPAALAAPAPDAPRVSFQAALSERKAKLRFTAVMVGGIALSVWGLLRLAAAGAEAPAALIGLVLGLYLFTTEPARRVIDICRIRATEMAGRQGHDDALANLRDAHVKLVGLELAVFVTFGLGTLVA